MVCKKFCEWCSFLSLLLFINRIKMLNTRSVPASLNSGTVKKHFIIITKAAKRTFSKNVPYLHQCCLQLT